MLLLDVQLKNETDPFCFSFFREMKPVTPWRCARIVSILSLGLVMFIIAGVFPRITNMVIKRMVRNQQAGLGCGNI